MQFVGGNKKNVLGIINFHPNINYLRYSTNKNVSFDNHIMWRNIGDGGYIG
jgi:hypothetical protein